MRSITVKSILVSASILFALNFKGFADSICGSGKTVHYTCPDGFTLSADNSSCLANPICPSGFVFNSERSRCEKTANSGDSPCESGIKYDQVNNVCYTDAQCPANSTLKGGNCRTSPQTLCVSDETPLFTGNYCFKDVNENGQFDPEDKMEKCKKVDNGEYYCPIDLVKCESKPSYTDPTCPEGYKLVHELIGTTCIGPDNKETMPICKEGTLTRNGECLISVSVCPYGDNYKCVPVNGVNYCSKEECVNFNNQNQSVETEADLSSYTNDGRYNSEGVCMGQIYIYSTARDTNVRPLD